MALACRSGCVSEEEFCAALAILDEENDTAGLVRGHGDRNHYVLGRVGNYNIGPLSAIRMALDMRTTFPRMRFILLVGIAGGAPSEKNDIRLGDVVLGTRVMPYTSGKKVGSGFERRGVVKTPPRELLDAITFLEKRMWSSDGGLSESIGATGWKAARGSAAFRHPGKTCDCQQPESRDQSNLRSRTLLVMMDAQTRDEIAKREDILCYEMEAIGVMEVAPCLSIGGISDYSDGHKNDDWKLYASLAAATCARELLVSVPAQVVALFPQGEVHRLHNLEKIIQRHLDDLQQMIEESSDMNWSEDEAAQVGYSELKSQVKRDRERVGQVTDAALSSLDTTSPMLKGLGKDPRDKNLHIAGMIFEPQIDHVQSHQQVTKWRKQTTSTYCTLYD
ncbi:nucleoside phosphorylase domain-containing protein [Aspergillus stella-maris]|uniref:nucleoside phosphorylase domain-containing protein n=1 Tax=Aspergillus stella-maris TaxID=1810926 RepID=UPI003CCD657C